MKLETVLEREILPRVEKPGRYLGNEWNSVHKSWSDVALRIVLAFPDLYEIGMSHLGLRILYHTLNARSDVLAERVYAPGLDLEKVLRSRQFPLFSLESHAPLREFDLFGFTIPHETCYTNILNMLDLAGFPLKAEKRSLDYPLVIGGGIGVFSPEPLAEFFDFFLLGDGEEAIQEIVDVLKDCRSGLYECKEEILYEFSKITGVYVPSFYQVDYNNNGTVRSVTPTRNGVPDRVTKRVVRDLDKVSYPTKAIVPHIDIVHDRVSIEIMRGCKRNCRFCQAGVIYRPPRERSVARIRNIADQSIANTGYDEISLSSLSTGDFSNLSGLIRALRDSPLLANVNISLSSLHVDTFCHMLVEDNVLGKKSGFTFAPETASIRLQQVINKPVAEERLIETARLLYRSGWKKIKLYFMIGLPTELEDDLGAIIRLSKEILRTGSKRNTVTVSISSFVPRPHTPFQWEPMVSEEEIIARQNYLRERLRSKRISFKWHDVHVSFLEAVFARGDRRLSKLLIHAWEKGCRFDSWSDQFRFDKWQEAFQTSSIDPFFYTCRVRNEEEVFPWDHLDCGLKKSELYHQYCLGQEGSLTGDCRNGKCIDCKVCFSLGIK